MRTFSHKCGATFGRELAISRDGDPFDLTGATVRASVRTADGHFVGNLSPVLVRAVDGIVGVVADAAATASWTPGRAFYDARISLPGGQVIVSPSYEFDIEKGATRG